MIESDAWRTASIHVRRVVDRVMLEHMAHAGTENGNLAVTWSDFEKAGVRYKTIKLAIEDACQRGLITLTVKGRASVGQDRWPARYALGWLPLSNGSAAPNRWKAWHAAPSKRHITQHLRSRGQNAPGENGGKPWSPGAKTPLANDANPSKPRGQNAPREKEFRLATAQRTRWANLRAGRPTLISQVTCGLKLG
jgi:hypothetical protein